MEVIEYARAYIAAGLSVIPVKADGSKAPSLKTGEVETFRERFATEEELQEWFAPNRGVGLAIICGKISGNLAVLDFESDSAWQTWLKRIEETPIMAAIQECPVIKTPKGGRHVYYRIAETWVSGPKLARRSDKETIIEVRGQGQYVLAVGCPVACHELNISYVFDSKGWLKEGVKSEPILKSVWDASCDCAREQNEYIASERVQHRAPQGESNAKGDRPGDEFNRKASWHDVLEPHGWRIHRAIGNVIYWTRPGKDPRIGCSATTGRCHTEGRGDLLYVFSSNALPLESEAGYSKFAAFTLLNYTGDYAAAGKELYRQGYSSNDPASVHIGEAWKDDALPQVDSSGVKRPPDDGIAPDPDFATNKDFESFDLSVKWVWDRWLQFGTVNLLAAEGGLGKTRFMADLCRRVACKLPWPDGTSSIEWKGEYLAMWVAGDRNHAELVDLSRKFNFYDRISYSGSKNDPFGGITLNTVSDFTTLYRRLKAARPLFLVIDTAGGSTGFNMAKQEEARSFFAPLSDMAAKLGICVVVITHLNASKTVLGKRAEERVRCVIRMSAADKEPTTPRRLEIVKSNALYPNPIGMLLGENGNEFDTENVPAGPEGLGAAGNAGGSDDDDLERGPPTKVRACMDWLELELTEKPRKVFELRKEAEIAGFNSKLLYKAKSALEIIESEAQSYKWWALKK